MGRLFFLILGIPAAAWSAANPPMLERFSGSGRACYGALEIRAATIAWNTPFSTCPESRFKVLDRIDGRGKSGAVYEVQEPSKSCRFRVISLVQTMHKSSSPIWEATGYGTVESYKADKRRGFRGSSPDMLTCGLVPE